VEGSNHGIEDLRHGVGIQGGRGTGKDLLQKPIERAGKKLALWTGERLLRRLEGINHDSKGHV